jgi:hypothetical protein
MPNMTLAIPAELRNQMAVFPEINWSEVARQAIMDKVRTLARMNELLRNSSVTEAEAITTGRKIRARVARKQQER